MNRTYLRRTTLMNKNSFRGATWRELKWNKSRFILTKTQNCQTERKIQKRYFSRDENCFWFILDFIKLGCFFISNRNISVSMRWIWFDEMNTTRWDVWYSKLTLSKTSYFPCPARLRFSISGLSQSRPVWRQASQKTWIRQLFTWWVGLW